MALDHLNRQQRRAMVHHSRKLATGRPERLVQITDGRMDQAPPGCTHAYESSRFFVQLFDEPPFQGIDTRRLSICRTTLQPDGDWEQNISWEELMQCKREIGFGDWYGVEIYPRDADVVNVANLRHLWILARPLRLGWFSGG